MCNKHVVALIYGPQELLLEIRICPPNRSYVAPRLALGRIDQGTSQLGRHCEFAAPHELLLLLVPRLDALALDSLLGYFVQCTNLRHVPAPPAKVGYEPEIFVLSASRKRPERFGGLRREVLDTENELGIGNSGARFRGNNGAVEGGEGGDGFLAVYIIYQESSQDINL